MGWLKKLTKKLKKVVAKAIEEIARPVEQLTNILRQIPGYAELKKLEREIREVIPDPIRMVLKASASLSGIGSAFTVGGLQVLGQMFSVGSAFGSPIADAINHTVDQVRLPTVIQEMAARAVSLTYTPYIDSSTVVPLASRLVEARMRTTADAEDIVESFLSTGISDASRILLGFDALSLLRENPWSYDVTRGKPLSFGIYQVPDKQLTDEEFLILLLVLMVFLERKEDV